MPKILLAFVLIIMPAAQALAASFTVTITEDAPRYATIEARLTPKDGRVSLSRDARDTGLYHGWATFVHEIEALDVDGNAIALEYIPGGHWQLSGHDGGPITVRYTMLLQHDRFPNDPGEDELAWARDWGVMWTGRALFLEGQDDGEINVSFDIPDGWKVSVPWDRPDPKKSVFTMPDYDALLDSAFVAGTHKEIVIGDAQAPQAILALGGESPLAAADLITGLVNQALADFTGLFGAPPSQRLFLVAADGSFWGGGVMGSSISMIFGGPLDEATVPMVAYITTHEMFHLWNANFNYAGVDAADALQWFLEGAAEYYTWRDAVRGGLVDADTFLAELGKRYGQYLAALGELSLSEAGPVKLDHYDLIYSGGMMAVGALDLTIRSATDGAKSMDDALRLIQARYPAGSAEPLHAEDLPGLIAEATGVDVTAIFADYITGNQALSMGEFFALAGLSLRESAEAGAFEVAIDETRSEEQAMVWNGLVAAKAPLLPGTGSGSLPRWHRTISNLNSCSFAHAFAISHPASACRITPVTGPFHNTRAMRLLAEAQGRNLAAQRSVRIK